MREKQYIVTERAHLMCPNMHLGNFQSKSGKFLGTVIFGYEKRNGYSVTNLGNVNNLNIVEAMFIPPASPANKKTMGVLSVNGLMKKCTVNYKME
ncbi:hypothetical protein ACTPEO_07820 [Clostridioides difficile]